MSESYKVRAARLWEKLARCPKFKVNDLRAWRALEKKANAQMKQAIVFATIWGRLMQCGVSSPDDLHQLNRDRIKDLRREANLEELSDEQLRSAAYLLAEHWVFGDHLRSELDLT